MKKLCVTTPAPLTRALIAMAFLAPLTAAHAAGTTSVSVGADYASGDYGTAETTDTYSLPVSVKYETGPWTLRASIPYVRVEGTFSRDQGALIDDNGNPVGDDDVLATSTKRSESGIGDLVVAAHYTLINNPDGYSFDIGGKAKLATADKDKTLITSGENDYSVQLDFYRASTSVALFATLGYTVKGEPTGVSYKDPVYGSLGLSVPLAAGKSVGAAWDYRQKVFTNGDPINELSGFFSMKFDPHNKMQLYVVYGLSDGSPDYGGGVVLTHTY